MEVFIKDQAFVFDRRLVGNYDASIIVYTQKLGIQNIFIQNAQIIKNLPYVYLDKFSYMKVVFTKLKEEKIYIHEIDEIKTLGLDVAKDLDRFSTLSKISSLIYLYAPYSDRKIFNLYKKTVYFSLKSQYVSKYYLAFLVKFNYLLGIYNPSVFQKEYANLLNSILTARISEIDSLRLEAINIQKLSEKLTENIKRWLS